MTNSLRTTRNVGIYIFDEVEVLDLGGTVRGVLHGFAHKGQAI